MDEKRPKLYEVCKDGNLEEVEKWIRDIPPYPYKLIDYNSGLIGACESGNINIAILTIEKGANNFDKALHKACEKGHLYIVMLLIMKGAKDLYSGFLVACEKGHVEIVDFLVKSISDSGNGFLTACEKGHLDVVKLLIDKQKFIGDPAFINACIGGNIDIVKLIINRTGTGISHKAGFMTACYKGHTDIVNLIISKNETVKEHGFVYACLGGHEDIFHLLFPSFPGVSVKTPEITEHGLGLVCACYSGNENIAKTLIRTQNDILRYDVWKSCMLNATKKRHNNIINLLMQNTGTGFMIKLVTDLVNTTNEEIKLPIEEKWYIKL